MSELPSITPLTTTPPNRSMQDDAYVPLADSFAAWMPVVANDIAAAIDWMQLTFEATDQAKTQAAESAQASAAARDKSQAWAESESAPEAGSKSSKTWAGESEAHSLGAKGYKESTEVIAASVQAAAGYPSLVGKAGQKLGVKADESGVEFQGDPPAFEVGQIILSSPSANYAGFLRLDGSTVLRSAYPEFDSWVVETESTDFYIYESLLRETPGTLNLASVVWDGSQFLAVGNQQGYSSTDGITWSLFSISGGFNLQDIAWNGQIFVAVGVNGANGSIVSSPDGITWTVRSFPTTSRALYGVVWGGDKFVAVGNELFLASSDGITWTDVTPGGYTTYAVTYNGSTFVAAGTVVMTSHNGTAWTFRGNVPNFNDVSGIASNGSRLIVTGASGRISTSDDNGVSWTSRSTPSSSDLYGITGNNNMLLAVGAGGLFLTSTDDGVTWEQKTVPAGTGILRGVTVAGNQFVAVGDGGAVMTYAPSDALLLEAADSNLTGYIKVTA